MRKKQVTLQLCACGCGQTTNHWHGQVRKFVLGHNGRTLPPGTLPAEAKIDEQDRDLAAGFSWYRHCGYLARSDRSTGRHRKVFLHRIILERSIGRRLLPYEVTDHVNHDILDNRRENLRAVRTSENACNRTGATKTSKSGVRGVTYRPKHRTWRARVGLDGKRINIGDFATLEAAAAAVEAARRQHHGEFAS